MSCIRSNGLNRAGIRRWGEKILLMCLFFALSWGCRKVVVVTPSEPPHPSSAELAETSGYSIQVGAFSRVDYAVRMTEFLKGQGIEAYYFNDRSGLYKVRFGRYRLRSTAEVEAARLVRQNIIPEFYIVHPEVSPEEITAGPGGNALRSRIVESAVDYHGLPYCWGGTSPEEGFDCSGLAVAVYDINGLSIPRTCREQYGMGQAVFETDLLPGDLVFFDIKGSGRASHVGIYIGDGRFIHAPSRNKTIRTDSLQSPYYRRRFLGARRFIR